MAFKGVLSVVFVCLFGLGSATYCTDDSDCDTSDTWSSETCCTDSVCRETCIYCSYDSQCGTGEECCTDGVCRSVCSFSCSYDYQCDVGEECCGDGECSSACTYYSSDGSTAGGVVGTIGFFAFISLIVCCRYCAYSPYYRNRTPAAVIVAQQPGYQQFVSTLSTTQSNQMQQYPPPGFNQPPPGYNQPPPAYPSYPQYPAPQGQAQVSMPPPVSAGQPVGKNQFVQ